MLYVGGVALITFLFMLPGEEAPAAIEAGPPTDPTKEQTPSK